MTAYKWLSDLAKDICIRHAGYLCFVNVCC